MPSFLIQFYFYRSKRAEAELWLSGNQASYPNYTAPITKFQQLFELPKFITAIHCTYSCFKVRSELFPAHFMAVNKLSSLISKFRAVSTQFRDDIPCFRRYFRTHPCVNILALLDCRSRKWLLYFF